MTQQEKDQVMFNLIREMLRQQKEEDENRAALKTVENKKVVLTTLIKKIKHVLKSS
jgi:hypothetical protein